MYHTVIVSLLASGKQKSSQACFYVLRLWKLYWNPRNSRDLGTITVCYLYYSHFVRLIFITCVAHTVKVFNQFQSNISWCFHSLKQYSYWSRHNSSFNFAVTFNFFAWRSKQLLITAGQLITYLHPQQQKAEKETRLFLYKQAPQSCPSPNIRITATVKMWLWTKLSHLELKYLCSHRR